VEHLTSEEIRMLQDLKGLGDSVPQSVRSHDNALTHFKMCSL
jgi:hypothetical protein